MPVSKARSSSARSLRTSRRLSASMRRPKSMSTWSPRASSTRPRWYAPRCRTLLPLAPFWGRPKPWSPNCRRNRRRRCPAVAAAWVEWAEWVSKDRPATDIIDRRRPPPGGLLFWRMVQRFAKAWFRFGRNRKSSTVTPDFVFRGLSHARASALPDRSDDRVVGSRLRPNEALAQGRAGGQRSQVFHFHRWVDGRQCRRRPQGNPPA